jgi:hypothetical protein
MTNTETAPWADLLGLYLATAKGWFPGPILEQVIARMEART